MASGLVPAIIITFIVIFSAVNPVYRTVEYRLPVKNHNQCIPF